MRKLWRWLINFDCFTNLPPDDNSLLGRVPYDGWKLELERSIKGFILITLGFSAISLLYFLIFHVPSRPIS